jgi:hypothetical protein
MNDHTKILVEALLLGFYDDRRIKPGVQFYLKEPKDVSKKWMKVISDPDDELKNGKKERQAPAKPTKPRSRPRPAPKTNDRKSDEVVI